jgi:hypothetical protein
LRKEHFDPPARAHFDLAVQLLAFALGLGKAEAEARCGFLSPHIAVGSRSVRSEGIAGAANGLQVLREPRVTFDFAAQPGHLDVDIPDITAELTCK